MFVHTIKASFFRKRKPADYEGCDVSAEVTATLTEGEDYKAALREIADETAIVVYQRIGMPAHAIPVFSTTVAAGVATAISVGERVTVTPTAAPKAAETAVPAAPKADGESKGRGRPAMTEEEKVAARIKRDAEKAAEKAAEKLAAAGTKTPEERGQIATNPENRIDPATGIPEEAPTETKTTAPAASKSTDGIPDETPAPAKKTEAPKAETPAGDGLTEAELQAYVQGIVISKKLLPGAIKAIFREVSGVEQMQHMKDPAVRLKVKAAIEAAIEVASL